MIEGPTRWDYPDEIVLETCLEAARLVPDCDAVCQTGAGMRTSFIVDDFETKSGKPLVATDIAIFWAVMDRLGIKGKDNFGQLIAGCG